MRIDRFWARALPLAALLTAGPAGSLLAQSPPPTAAPNATGGTPRAAVAIPSEQDRVVSGDHVVRAGEEVEDMVVVGGNLTVQGRIRGDAVVVGGDLILASGGEVGGDALITGGEIVDQGGRVRGEMRVMDGSDDPSHPAAGGVAAEARREAIAEAREEAREERRRARDRREDRDDDDGWGDYIRKGFSGLISTVAFGLLLAGIGAALIFYGRPYLETVSDTVRHATLRSGGVGLAAGFLAIPAFVVLVVALAVSIIGIPLLLFAVPMYPLAVAAAAALGLLAVAHAVGERTAEQRHEAFNLRYRNSYSYLFTGLGMLLAPLVAANLIRMTGFLGFIGTLLLVVTWTVIWLATTVGFGAVILSRGGTRRTWVAPSPLDSSFEAETLFDEPAGRSPHV